MRSFQGIVMKFYTGMNQLGRLFIRAILQLMSILILMDFRLVLCIILEDCQGVYSIEYFQFLQIQMK
jgi:hypothetical protein